VVALDLTIALNPKNKPFTIQSHEKDYVEFHAAHVNRFLTRLDKDIRRWATRASVLGVVVHDNQLRLDHEGNWELSGMTIQMPLAESDEGLGVFEKFFRAYTSALPNRTDL
jgi:hypothetical protein